MNKKINRILIKLSGEALEKRELADGAQRAQKTDNIDFSSLNALARELKEIANMGIEVAVLLGGGNIWRGRNAQNLMERNRADHMGMLATLINSLALLDVLLKNGVAARVFSAVEVQRFAETFTSRGADECLKRGEVAIFAAGSGSPFFTTDTAAALRACEINADALFLAKNVDALYDKDPNKFDDAVKLEAPTYDDLIRLNVRGVDQAMIALCRDNSMPFYVFELKGKDCILNAVRMKNIGTRVEPD